MSRPSADVFDPAALAANQAGRIGDTQLSWLRAEKWQSRSWSLLMGIALLIVGVALLVTSGSAGALYILGALALVAGGVFYLARGVLSFSGLMADLRSPHVVSIDGELVLSKEHMIQPAPHDEFYANIAGKRIYATVEQFNVAPQSHRVRLYYLPHGLRAINWERLPDPPPAPTLEAADVQALRERLVGRWSDGVVTLEFDAGGRSSVELPHGKRLDTRWSLDRTGRLTTDVFGADPVEVALTDGNLSVSEKAGRKTYTRAG